MQDFEQEVFSGLLAFALNVRIDRVVVEQAQQRIDRIVHGKIEFGFRDPG